LLNAALDYTLATGDESLLEDTMAAYQWIEDNLRRDRVRTFENGLANGESFTVSTVDYIYWNDYNEGRIGQHEETGPAGGTRPLHIAEASSVSSLLGNMGMGVLQSRLYRITGDRRYYELTLETVRAVNDHPHYNNKGVYVNDRDAWANSSFAGQWVREVLTLDGVTDFDKRRIYETAVSVYHNCRTPEGFWRAEWSGGDAWVQGWAGSRYGGTYRQIMTNGTTVGMLSAAALLEKQEQMAE
jgi:hypothetical protein